MKSPLLIIVAILLIVTMACTITLPISFNTVKTGPVQTLNINEPVPSGPAPVALNLGMGAGTLTVTGGGSGLVDGTVKYNVPDWKPTITSTDNSVSIKVDTQITKELPNDKVVNDWNLKLGNVPMDLTIDAGAYNGTVDLSGVPLTNLSISDGASSAKVLFSSPNPEKMKRLSYKTGASLVDMEGLANANFSEMRFDGGAGSYTLEFSGQLQQSANVIVTSGVSNITLIVPVGTPSRITLAGSLNNVVAQGTFTIDGKVYETAGEGPALDITVETSVGSLTLISK
jgi:hypothetical protein